MCVLLGVRPIDIEDDNMAEKTANMDTLGNEKQPGQKTITKTDGLGADKKVVFKVHYNRALDALTPDEIIEAASDETHHAWLRKGAELAQDIDLRNYATADEARDAGESKDATIAFIAGYEPGRKATGGAKLTSAQADAIQARADLEGVSRQTMVDRIIAEYHKNNPDKVNPPKVKK